MQQGSSSTKKDEFGLMELLSFTAKAAPYIVLFASLAGVVTYWRYNRVPFYTSDALLIVESPKSNHLQAVTDKIAGTNALNIDDTERTIDKYFILFQSSDFSTKVAEKLQAEGKFDHAADLFTLNGKRPKDASELSAQILDNVGLTKMSSETFRMSIMLTSPQRAVEALTLMMDVYPTLISERESRELSEARAFLQEQITDVEKRVAAFDDLILQRRMLSRKERINMGLASSREAGTEQKLEQALFAVREQLDEVRALIKSSEQNSRGESTEGFLPSDKYNASSSTENLKRREMLLQLRYDSTQKLLREVRSTPDPGLREDREIQDLYKRKELEYQMFSDLKKEIMRVDLQRISIRSKIRVLDRPNIALVHSGDTLKPLMIKRCLFAAIFALLFVFLREMYNPMVSGRKDMTGLGLVFMGSVPNMSSRRKFSIPFFSNSMRADAEKTRRSALMSTSNAYFDMVFRNISARVMNFRPNDKNPPQVISVISATSHEGKTTVSSNLARSFAKSGKRTLLVDCDLRRRTLSTLTEHGNVRGLVEYLVNPETKFTSPVVKKLDKNLDFIPAGSVPTDAMELVSSKTFQEFTEAMRHYYEVIVFDTPPAVPCSEVIPIANVSDFVLLTTIVGGTRISHVHEVIEKLQFSLKAPLGYVLNKYEESSSFAYYSDYSALVPATSNSNKVA